MLNCLKISLSLIRTIHRAAGDILGRLTARPARLFLRTQRVQQKAFAFATLLGLSAATFAATAPNSAITNIATATYSVGANNLTATSTVAINTAACLNIGLKIELLQYIPPAGAALAPAGTHTETVQPTGYAPSGALTGPFTPLANPTLLGNPAPTPLPANLLLAPLSDAAGKPIASYARNEPIFVRVVSYDSNLNPAVADQISMTLTTNGGDNEVLQLTETGLSTGVFVGSVQSVFAALGTAPTPNDGKITISAHNETLTQVYNHLDCTSGANIATSSSGLIDPYGIVFDSRTGAPLNGATVSLINTLTNLPATVYCNDAVTVLPQPVISGQPTICDAVMAAGSFHLPYAAVGSYRLVVTPPPGYLASTIAPANLPATVGMPAVTPIILGTPGPIPGGSYGGMFSLAGAALKVDIPLDPGTTSLTIQKAAGKAVVGIGEFVPYTLTLSNSGTLPVIGALIADHPPPGFRYQKGSVRLNGAVMPDPLAASDARTLTFTLNIAAVSTATLRYVLEVTPGAHTGMAENTAAASGGFTSNTARASVLVREDLFRNKAILIGRVIDGPCDDQVDNDAKGLAGARVVLQDGTYVLTDQAGRWHIDNLRAGTHVVQLDLDSLPKDYEVASCEKNSRFAGRMYSQFVNLRGGTLWRADFHVHKKAAIATHLAQTLSAKPDGDKATVSLALVSDTEVTGYSATVMLPEAAKYVPGSAKLNGGQIADPEVAGSALVFRNLARSAHWQDQYRFDVTDTKAGEEIKSLVRFTPPDHAAQNVPAASVTLGRESASTETSAEVIAASAATRSAKTATDDDPTRLVETLPYDEGWLSGAQPGNEWLHPQESFHPNLPVMKVAVKHDPKHKLLLTVNGEAVNPLLFDGTQMNAQRSVALSTWNAVPVKEGDNKVVLIISDEQGKEVSRTERIIYYSQAPDHVEFVPQQSRLIADGKTRPMIAVRFLDKNDVPVRRGISGEFQLNEPYRAFDRRIGIDREPLTGQLGGKARYQVMRDGLAMIELEPTTQSGDAILNFQFNDQRKQEVRAWLAAGQRDWILAGFAEGTAGYKTLSGNLQALQAADTEKQLFDGNKLAFYAKGSIRGDYLLTMAYDTAKQTGNKLLKQAVDPTQYYTLYTDASQARFDAATASRLYVKLERNQFYAMFGDYDTGLSVTELSRYSRTLNGVKSEYKGERAGYNAFATLTAQSYIKDEIPGNGTSGVYKLSRGNLMINSDKIRVESRDRFQSQNIVTTQNLTRYLDYDIDYALGTLTFHEPIATRDSNFNPTYIVAEYESADPADKAASFGGRGSFKPSKETDIGATLIHEGTMGAAGDLQGVDASYQLDANTRLRAEAATTRRNRAGVPSSGSAWLGEVQHREAQWDAKAYVREQASGFGVGQQAGSEIGTRKMGVDSRVKLSDTMRLQGQAYKQENLSTNANNSVLEGRVDQKVSDDLSAYYGARNSQDNSAIGNKQSNQLIAGAAYTMPDKKIALHGAAEIGPGTAGSVTMPDRVIFGADYKVTGQTKLFAEQEFARGELIAANTTRAGVRTQPWTGGEVSSSVGNSTNNDAERLYTNLGLVQRWQISKQWQTDFSVDRSQTLRNSGAPINLNTPLPYGSMTGDYTAASVGAAFHDRLWSGNGRIEIRNASIAQQKNLQLGMQRNLSEGRAMAAGFTMRNANGTATGSTRNSDLRLSYAHRPNDSKWVWFDRADYITQSSQAAALSLKGAKLVNNLNANYMPNRRTQIALQYGAKYVQDAIDGTDYKGYTDLLGTEIRYDLTQDWDIGTFASMMRSLNSGVRDYGMGASVGYNLMENIWVSLGYNLRGLSDRDFSAAAYRARGPFVTLRMKVDQDTFGLNKGNAVIPPMTHDQ